MADILSDGEKAARLAALEASDAAALKDAMGDEGELARRAAAARTTSTQLKVYSAFTTDDVVNNMSRRVTTGLWTGNTGSLATFFTSSTQSGSTGDWYYDVYNLDPATDSTAAVQFSVAYGHRTGGGYPNIDTINTSKEPTKATYAQYRNILLDPEDDQFTFGNSYSSDDIYVINIQRSRLKQKMDDGNWELTLKTGSAILTLIDDSADNYDKYVSTTGRVYNVVSGSIVAGSTTTIKTPAASEPSGGLGLFYPDRGIIILNPRAIYAYLNITASSAVTAPAANNHGALFDAIVSGSHFQARNEEVVTSTHYFVRVKNRDYNFSNNPTFYTSSDGGLKISSFIGDPRVYLTTIGLYNNSNELLAVGKLSQPILKSFDREALVKIKLDY